LGVGAVAAVRPADGGPLTLAQILFIRSAPVSDMSLQLRFFATFREAVGNKTISREYDANTVGDVIVALESEFEGLEGQILEDGAIRPQVNVLLNGSDVEHMEGLDTPIEPDDTFSIFPPVAGGCS
jgi:molybdopterin synthase sulfur carrier subunit